MNEIEQKIANNMLAAIDEVATTTTARDTTGLGMRSMMLAQYRDFLATVESRQRIDAHAAGRAASTVSVTTGGMQP